MIQIMILLSLVIAGVLSASLSEFHGLLFTARQETNALIRFNHEAAMIHCIEKTVSDRSLSCWSKEALPTSEGLLDAIPSCQIKCQDESLTFWLFQLNDQNQTQCVYHENDEIVMTILQLNQSSVRFVLRKTNLKL